MISVPSGSVTVTSDPAGAVPLISLSPAFGFVIVGDVVFSSDAFGPAVSFTSVDGSLSPSFATTLISSFSAISLPSGSFAVQFPSWSAFVLISVPSGSVTVTSDPAGAVPLISLSPAFGFVIVGDVVFSAGVACPSNAASASFNCLRASSTSFCFALGSFKTVLALSKAVSYASFLVWSAFLYLSEFFIASFLFLSASSWSSVLSTFSTKLTAGIVSVDPSGYLIVALPVSSTSTVVPCGNLSLFASSIAFLTVSFSSLVKFVGSATGVFAGTTGSIFSACVFVIISGSEDLFPLASSACALTFVPGLNLSAGITMLPPWSTFNPLSAGLNVQLLPSFVAITSLSPYLIVTVAVSASFGGVIVTLPSSFSFNSGRAGACLSSDFIVFSSEVFAPSFATAFTSVPFLILLAGMLIKPESLFIFTPSTFGSSFHSPVVGSFLAVTFCSASLVSL